MNRLNLKKYGFYRTPTEDFNDDGTKFTCYSLKGADRIRLSKTRWEDEIFLRVVINGDLDYDEYSKLPHYKNIGRLNGVFINELTEEDIKQFMLDCIEYQKEYGLAEIEKNKQVEITKQAETTGYRKLLTAFETQFKDELYKITVAKELECADFKNILANEQDFDLACDYIYNLFLTLDSDCSVERLTSRFMYNLCIGNITIKDLKENIKKIDTIFEDIE